MWLRRSRRKFKIIHFENIQRVIEDETTNSVEGAVSWSPAKSLFLCSMYAISLAGIVFFFTFDAFAVFLVKTALVLLLGHSVGMHRRLIHKSFESPLWLDYVLVYVGVLTGLGGPFTMIRTHDLRDWAQRKPECHDYFAHRRHFILDAFWQMHCDVVLSHPPRVVLEAEIADSKFYNFIEKHWIAVHLPWVLLFYWVGGIPWVIWGVCAQIATTVTGHWLIGYIAHQDEATDWHVKGAGVQGYNVRFCGLMTMGECWHNNHHAFPGSALIGINKGQTDPGWWFIKFLEAVGLAKNIRVYNDLPMRPELEWIEKSET